MDAGVAKPADPADTDSANQAWRRYLAHHAKHKPAVKFPYEVCFKKSAKAHGLPITLLLAVARGESDFDPRARSHANAHGLMQILWPDTARHLGIRRLADLYRPCTNVDAGARYLKELLNRYEGNLHLALAAYNYGPARIRIKAEKIPKGAEWYSGYIYRHLLYVIGKTGNPLPSRPQNQYSDERKIHLVAFGTPYRAAAFVSALQKAAPGVRLEWFRTDVDSFQVYLLFRGEDDLARSKRLASRAGFLIR
jgi:hypothetical protein